MERINGQSCRRQRLAKKIKAVCGITCWTGFSGQRRRCGGLRTRDVRDKGGGSLGITAEMSYYWGFQQSYS